MSNFSDKINFVCRSSDKELDASKRSCEAEIIELIQSYKSSMDPSLKEDNLSKLQALIEGHVLIMAHLKRRCYFEAEVKRLPGSIMAQRRRLDDKEKDARLGDIGFVVSHETSFEPFFKGNTSSSEPKHEAHISIIANAVLVYSLLLDEPALAPIRNVMNDRRYAEHLDAKTEFSLPLSQEQFAEICNVVIKSDLLGKKQKALYVAYLSILCPDEGAYWFRHNSSAAPIAEAILSTISSDSLLNEYFRQFSGNDIFSEISDSFLKNINPDTLPTSQLIDLAAMMPAGFIQKLPHGVIERLDEADLEDKFSKYSDDRVEEVLNMSMPSFQSALLASSKQLDEYITSIFEPSLNKWVRQRTLSGDQYPLGAYLFFPIALAVYEGQGRIFSESKFSPMIKTLFSAFCALCSKNAPNEKLLSVKTYIFYSAAFELTRFIHNPKFNESTELLRLFADECVCEGNDNRIPFNSVGNKLAKVLVSIHNSGIAIPSAKLAPPKQTKSKKGKKGKKAKKASDSFLRGLVGSIFEDEELVEQYQAIIDGAKPPAPKAVSTAKSTRKKRSAGSYSLEDGAGAGTELTVASKFSSAKVVDIVTGDLRASFSFTYHAYHEAAAIYQSDPGSIVKMEALKDSIKPFVSLLLLVDAKDIISAPYIANTLTMMKSLNSLVSEGDDSLSDCSEAFVSEASVFLFVYQVLHLQPFFKPYIDFLEGANTPVLTTEDDWDCLMTNLKLLKNTDWLSDYELITCLNIFLKMTNPEQVESLFSGPEFTHFYLETYKAVYDQDESLANTVRCWMGSFLPLIGKTVFPSHAGVGGKAISFDLKDKLSYLTILSDVYETDLDPSRRVDFWQGIKAKIQPDIKSADGAYSDLFNVAGPTDKAQLLAFLYKATPAFLSVFKDQFLPDIDSIDLKLFFAELATGKQTVPMDFCRFLVEESELWRRDYLECSLSVLLKDYSKKDSQTLMQLAYAIFSPAAIDKKRDYSKFTKCALVQRFCTNLMQLCSIGHTDLINKGSKGFELACHAAYEFAALFSSADSTQLTNVVNAIESLSENSEFKLMQLKALMLDLLAAENTDVQDSVFRCPQMSDEFVAKVNKDSLSVKAAEMVCEQTEKQAKENQASADSVIAVRAKQLKADALKAMDQATTKAEDESATKKKPSHRIKPRKLGNQSKKVASDKPSSKPKGSQKPKVSQKPKSSPGQDATGRKITTLAELMPPTRGGGSPLPVDVPLGVTVLPERKAPSSASSAPKKSALDMKLGGILSRKTDADFGLKEPHRSRVLEAQKHLLALDVMESFKGFSASDFADLGQNITAHDSFTRNANSVRNQLAHLPLFSGELPKNGAEWLNLPNSKCKPGQMAEYVGFNPEGFGYITRRDEIISTIFAVHQLFKEAESPLPEAVIYTLKGLLIQLTDCESKILGSPFTKALSAKLKRLRNRISHEAAFEVHPELGAIEMSQAEQLSGVIWKLVGEISAYCPTSDRAATPIWSSFVGGAGAGASASADLLALTSPAAP